MEDMALDIREMSFQNVLNQILTPAGVKVGGFPEEIFVDIGEEEKEKWLCNICYLIVNDCRQCDNKHLFCNTCIFAWSMTYGENSQKCPLCRNEQKEYSENREVNKSLQDKRVNCPEETCMFKSPLKIFLMHSHGKMRFSNTHVDLESLRPARPHGARLLLLPSLALGQSAPRSRAERGSLIRNQLQQGRMMINQMMLLLHLEMQLRQQAFTSFRESRNSDVRVQRLDEVLALNEQLNEVGGILSTLLNTPINNVSNVGPTANNSGASSTSDVVGASGIQAVSMTPMVPARHANLFDDSETENDNSDTDDSSSLSSMSTTIFSLRPPATIGNVPEDSPIATIESVSRSQVPRLDNTLRDGQNAIDVARQRRSTTRAVLGSNTDTNAEQDSTDTNHRRIGPTGLLARRNDQPRSLLSARSRPDESTEPAVHVQLLGVSRDTRTSPRENVQLPQISDNPAGQNTRLRASVVRPPSVGRSRTPRGNAAEETRTTNSSMPAGSSALTRVMRDINQEPNLHRTTTTTVRDDVTISVSSSTPIRRREPTVLGSDVQQSTRKNETSGRASSTENEQKANSTADSSTGGRNREGQILPASLYRRRQQSDASVVDSNTGATQPTNRIPSQNNTRVSRQIRGQVIGHTQNRLSNQNTSYSRQNQQVGQSQINSSLLPNPSVRPKVKVDRTRRSSQLLNGIDTRPRELRTRTGLGSPSRTPISHRRLSQTHPDTENNLRSRRRSEIHEELLMRKDK